MNKEVVSFFESLEAEIRKSPIIKIEGDFPSHNGVEDFIYKLLHQCWNYKIKFIPRDESKRRSLGDIFNIVRGVYPKATLLEVQKTLLNNKNITYQWCSLIRKRVYMIKADMSMYYSIHKLSSDDEYGINNDVISHFYES